MSNSKPQKTPGLKQQKTSTSTTKRQKPVEIKKTTKNINPGDMVIIRHPDKQGKLQSQWYDPFIVASMVKPGVFRLLNEEGIETSHSWNADNLHRFYP